MARMPGAVWKPLPTGFGTPMARYDLVIIHTMVGSLAGTDGYFRSGKTQSNSHFGTGGGGEIWQWGDTAKRSAASGVANPRSISIENADMGPGFAAWNTGDGNAVPPFTPAQLEANARICAWAHVEHGVPLTLVPDSLPGRRGIAFHRLGVPGYAVPGGELWSSARGKVCPGPRRIAQIPQIIARAQQLVGATTTAQEDWMTTPISDANLDKIRRAVIHAPVAPNGDIKDGQPWFGARVAGGDGAANAVLTEVRKLATEVAALRADVAAVKSRTGA